MMTVIEKEMPATQFGQIKLQPGHPGEKRQKKRASCQEILERTAKAGPPELEGWWMIHRRP